MVIVCGGECVCAWTYVCMCVCVCRCAESKGVMCVWGGEGGGGEREICTKCDNVVTFQGFCHLPNIRRNKAR